MPEHDEVMQVTESQKQSHPKLEKEPGSAMLFSDSGSDFRALATPQSLLTMQRLAGNAAVAQLLSEGAATEFEEEGAVAGRSPVLDVVEGGGGRPLGDRTRASMERALGTDLSDVRIHDDSAASRSAEAIKARAYTVGNDVVFREGAYQPDTADGQRVLAHELTHVVQQRSGPVDGTASGDGIALSDPDDRFERAAEANADRIMADSAATAQVHAGNSPSVGGAIATQREDEDEQAGEEAEEASESTEMEEMAEEEEAETEAEE